MRADVPAAADNPVPTSPERPRMQLHPRLLMAAGIVALVMVPVSIALTALGVLALKVSGGADTDTSLVVFVAATAVSDFWGGGIVLALTRAARRDITVAWTVARAALLIVAALIASRMVLLAPVMLVLAVPACSIGVRMSAKHAALRRQALEAARSTESRGR